MRRRSLVLAGTAIATLASIVVSAQIHGQRVNSRKGLSRNATPNDATEVQLKYSPPDKAAHFADANSDPVFPVSVDSSVSLDQATLNLHQQMANALSGYATVPNSRTNYFSALNNHPEFTFGYWGATLENVQTVAGGNVVTVYVYPVFTNRSSILSPNDYTEQYLIGNDGSITYQGSADPNGYAGQMPSVIDL